jgi:hypothetical protein
MSLQVLFWSSLAIVFLVAMPVILLWSAIDYFRGSGSKRRGGGAFTAGVGAALQELDRLTARPSVEHKMDAERHAADREDVGGV